MTSTNSDKVGPVNEGDKDPQRVLGARQPRWVHQAFSGIADRRFRATGKKCSKADLVAEALHEKLEREGIHQPAA